MQAKILVIEDQPDINELVALNLESLNYEVKRCHEGNAGLELALNDQFDLLILDLMLPGMDGLQICKKLRAKGLITPVLMLTAKKSEADRVVGLEMGADDYLTKPFSILELQARVKALLRRVALMRQQQEQERHPPEFLDNDELNFDQLCINKGKRRVSLAGEPLKLTAKEFDLLLYMASSPGQVFSREQLLNAVWGYQYVGYEHTVNSHINRLRSKLESITGEPKFVLTVWGVGYKFYD